MSRWRKTVGNNRRSLRPLIESLEDRRLMVAGDLVQLDLGTASSELAAGQTRVTPNTVLTADNDIGFIDSGNHPRLGRNRTDFWGPHSRDFVESNQMTLGVRLHAGATYDVYYSAGDPISARRQDFYLEGRIVERANIAEREYFRGSHRVTVSDDGILDIKVQTIMSQPALLNTVTIQLVELAGPPVDDPPPSDPLDDPDIPPDGYRLDFGSAASAVAAGLSQVRPNTLFTSENTFGFESTSGLVGRNRAGVWGDHSRDFVEGDSLRLRLRVEPGQAYRLRFGMGDVQVGRSQRLSIEGSPNELLSLSRGAYSVFDRFMVGPADGVADITINSVGSSPAILNSLIVTAITDIPDDDPAPTCGNEGHLSVGNESPEWLDIFPDSTAPSFSTDQYPINCSNEFVPGTNWPGLDERQVFDDRITVNSTESNHAYEYRLGEGSQLYSLRLRDEAGRWREAIATQRPNNIGGRTAEWVDEVIQTIIVDQETNNSSSEATKNQIHQSGTYRNTSDPTFYSPVVAQSWQPEERTFSTISWPQQAHIPSNFQSHYMLMQQVKDLGSGVLEVTYVYQNFSQNGEKSTFLAAPWIPIRTSSLPFQFISQPNGTIRREQHTFCVHGTCGSQASPVDSTDGFFMFTAGSQPDSQALSIVFGTDQDDEGQTSRTNFRWGTVNEAGRDLTVGSLQKKVRIEPGEVFYQRYFLIANSLRESRILAQQLTPHVSQGFIRNSGGDESNFTDLCFAVEAGQLQECSGGNQTFEASSTPRAGWQPLLVAERASNGQTFITNDPYRLARRPYQEQYEINDIVGWIPQSTVVDLAFSGDSEIDRLFELSV